MSLIIFGFKNKIAGGIKLTIKFTIKIVLTCIDNSLKQSTPYKL